MKKGIFLLALLMFTQVSQACRLEKWDNLGHFVFWSGHIYFEDTQVLDLVEKQVVTAFNHWHPNDPIENFKESFRINSDGAVMAKARKDRISRKIYKLYTWWQDDVDVHGIFFDYNETKILGTYYNGEISCLK